MQTVRRHIMTFDKIKDIIIEQGIRVLDFLSAPIDSLVTVGMSKRLYYEHEQCLSFVL